MTCNCIKKTAPIEHIRLYTEIAVQLSNTKMMHALIKGYSHTCQKHWFVYRGSYTWPAKDDVYILKYLHLPNAMICVLKNIHAQNLSSLLKQHTDVQVLISIHPHIGGFLYFRLQYINWMHCGTGEYRTKVVIWSLSIFVMQFQTFGSCLTRDWFQVMWWMLTFWFWSICVSLPCNSYILNYLIKLPITIPTQLILL